MTTTETTRTIEQILAIRLRAAKLRIQERIKALVDEQFEIDKNWNAEPNQDRNDQLAHAKQLAHQDLELVQREIDSYKGLDVEPVQYQTATTFALKRYAAVLIEDDPELHASEALTQAQRDENARFEDFYARYHSDDELGVDDDQ